jgi:prefoldin subunit 5
MAGDKGWAETPLRAIGFLLGLAVMCWGIWSCVGCGKNGDPQQPPAPQKSKLDLDLSPTSETADDFGPLADAKERVNRFEKKRAALQPLLDKALADRDELVAKLREAGVEKTADLKGNSRGQQLATSLQRLSGEIDGLERSIAAIDQAIVEAQSVVRRLERERAGIGDEEMRKLAEQLREVEERTDGASSTPVTPLDVEAALDKALKGSRDSKLLKSSTALVDKRLVGKWEIVEGEQKGSATFTEGGTVLFVWFHPSLKKNWTETGKFTLNGKSLKIKASGEYGGESVREIEFLSDDELLVHRPKGFNFTWMYGRLKRAK